MTLVTVVAIVQVPPRHNFKTPAYLLRLSCSHTIRRGFQGGPIPKRVRCRECAG